MSFAVTTFRDWCRLYGCSHALYIGSFDFQHHRTVWDQSKLWNEADLNRTFLAEFGFIGTGNASALPPGADPVLLSKDTVAANHESGQMAQLTLNVVLGPAAFGLPPTYRFTIWDGQAAVTLEDPHQQGLPLWDGILRAMILAKSPPAPSPKPVPLPVPAPLPPLPPPLPAPAPAPAPADPGALPFLTPAGHRVIELEQIGVQFALLLYDCLVPTSLPARLLSRQHLADCVNTVAVPLRAITIPALTLMRLARKATGTDPRSIPPGDLPDP